MCNNFFNDSDRYRKNFIELKNASKFCSDYWNIANRYQTYAEALEGRGLRWVLYTVYVVQRERKTRWVELEATIKQYSFPKKLYCNYLGLLYKSGRLSKDSFVDALKVLEESFNLIDLETSQHWTKEFEVELKLLEQGILK